ncbi:amino acid permease, partial [Actinomadura adrarensis]
MSEGTARGRTADSGELARFGYEQSFERRTGRFASFAVAFAFVSIATGIFTTYGSVLNSSGPVGIWTWPIAVIGQLAVALVIGSLAARIPVTGYAYQWTSRLANPVLGWIIGWVSFMFLAVVVVAVDYTVASTILPVLLDYTASTANTWAITAVIVLLQGLLIGGSTRWTEKVNNGAVSAELVGMVALTVLLLVVAAVRQEMDFGNLWSRGAVEAEGFWGFGDWTSAGPWMLGFLLGSFTIVGFESAANLAEETNDPERVVP